MWLDVQVQHYAVTTLYHKISSEWASLSSQQQSQLQEKQLQILCGRSWDNKEHIIRHRLSRCAACIAVRLPRGPNKLLKQLDGNFMQQHPAQCLELLVAIPEEVERSPFLESHADKLKQGLRHHARPILMSCSQLLSRLGKNGYKPPELTTLALSALTSWCPLEQDLRDLNSGSPSVLESVLHCLRSIVSPSGPIVVAHLTAVVELLVAALSARDYGEQPELVTRRRSALEQIVVGIAACQSIFAKALRVGQSEICRCLCLAGLALAEEEPDFIVKGASSSAAVMSVIQIELQCTSHPQPSLVETSLDFWLALEESEECSISQNPRVWNPILKSLLQLLLKRAAFPGNFPGSWNSGKGLAGSPEVLVEGMDRESFEMFRRQVKQALLSICQVLRQQYIMLLASALESQPAWNLRESLYLGLTCVATEFQKEDYSSMMMEQNVQKALSAALRSVLSLPKVQESLSQSSASNGGSRSPGSLASPVALAASGSDTMRLPEVLVAAGCRLLSAYAWWLHRSAALLKQTVQFFLWAGPFCHISGECFLLLCRSTSCSALLTDNPVATRTLVSFVIPKGKAEPTFLPRHATLDDKRAWLSGCGVLIARLADPSVRSALTQQIVSNLTEHLAAALDQPTNSSQRAQQSVNVQLEAVLLLLADLYKEQASSSPALSASHAGRTAPSPSSLAPSRSPLCQTLPTLPGLWPLLSRISQHRAGSSPSVADALCALCDAVMMLGAFPPPGQSASLSGIEALLPRVCALLLTIFNRSMQAAALTGLATLASLLQQYQVSEQGAHANGSSGSSAGMSSAAWTASNGLMSALPRIQGVVARAAQHDPELCAAYLNLFEATLISLPGFLLDHKQADQLLSGALFLVTTALRTHGHNQKCAKYALSCVAALIECAYPCGGQQSLTAALRKGGQEVVAVLLFSLAHTTPTHLWRKVADPLYSLLRRMPDATLAWCKQAVASHELARPEVLSPRARELFLQAVWGLKSTLPFPLPASKTGRPPRDANQPKFRAMIQVFATICRSAPTSADLPGKEGGTISEDELGAFVGNFKAR
eukprot:g73450.t1